MMDEETKMEDERSCADDPAIYKQKWAEASLQSIKLTKDSLQM